MKYPGFIGGSYTLDAIAADCQRSVNLYPEAIESQTGQNVARLVATPGTVLFAEIGDAPARGHFTEPSSGRLFHVSGGTLYEVFADGTSTARGPIAGADPVTWASNRKQLAVCGGGQVYVLNLAANALTSPTQGGQIVATDGYLLTFMPGTQEFQLANPLDWLNWNGLDFASKEGCPDNIVGIFADHRELWLLGPETIEVWGDSGNADFPFERLSGAFTEQGTVAAASAAKLDNTFCWLGGSSRGGPVAWRANGYTPQRISTHALEIAWSKYARCDDAIGHAEQWQGHNFWVLTFPSADATWVYDAATNLWHERALWDGRAYRAHLATYHSIAFGKRLVSGWRDGDIYEFAAGIFTDEGASWQ